MKSVWTWIGIAGAIGLAAWGIGHGMSRQSAPAREGVTHPAADRPATERQGHRAAPAAAVLSATTSNTTLVSATGALERGSASPARDPAAWIGELLAGNQVSQAANVFDEWVRRDPAAAWACLASLKIENPAAKTFYHLLGENLVNHPPDWDNPAQVVAQAAALLAGAARDSLLASLYQVWGYRDLAPALAHAAALPGSDGKNLAVGNLLKIWGETDLAAAVAWANRNVADDRDYEAAIRFMAEKMIYRSPERAALLLEAVPGLQHPDYGLVRRTVNQWIVYDDPAKAARWIAALENDGVREAAMASLAADWARRSPDNCLAWILGQPDAGRDTALAAGEFAKVQALARPEASVDWMAGLEPGYARARCIAQYAASAAYRPGSARAAGGRPAWASPGMREALGALQAELNSSELSLDAIQAVLRATSLDPARRDRLAAWLEDCYR